MGLVYSIQMKVANGTGRVGWRKRGRPAVETAEIITGQGVLNLYRLPHHVIFYNPS